ncbi:hypothetical protein GCM10009647_070470 [Streptomyces sanglieri]
MDPGVLDGKESEIGDRKGATWRRKYPATLDLHQELLEAPEKFQPLVVTNLLLGLLQRRGPPLVHTRHDTPLHRSRRSE